jgi:hypothetical protein
MRRGMTWILILLAGIAAYLSSGATPLAAACPPTPDCPCL